MKFAPKSVLLAVLLFVVFVQCRESAEKNNTTPVRDQIEKPELQKKDSNSIREPGSHPLPDAKHPGHGRKKSSDDLDTLKAIKA